MKRKIEIHQVIGYTLLLPAIFYIFIYFIYVIFKIEPVSTHNYTEFIYRVSMARYGEQAPVYFGLMALAGAYLIKPIPKS